MNLAQTMVYSPIRVLSRTLCCVDDVELQKIPCHGPLILVANHVNFLDIPVFYTHLIPRSVTGFAKIETWNNPILGPLFSLGGAIPIRRGEVDRRAISSGLEVLRSGRIMAIAPEGTRSGDGRLMRAKPGAVVLALSGNVPIYPVAYYGGENFWQNLPRLRRTDFHFRVGTPFRVRVDGERIPREVRQQIVDEIMYRIAVLLPPEYRGYYSDISMATSRFLCDDVQPQTAD